VATHNLELIRDFDRRITLIDGKVVQLSEVRLNAKSSTIDQSEERGDGHEMG
jgi:ABC-type lipoprotein export system ATPase subunit